MLSKIFKVKPLYVIDIHRDSLSFYTQAGGSHQLPLDKNIVKNLGQVDSDLLDKKIESFLKKNNIKPGKAIIVLQEDILFLKNIVKSKLTDKKIKSFTSKIPIDPEFLNTKVYEFGKKPVVVSANKQFYGAFKSVFEKLDWKIVSIIPSAVLEAKKLNLSSVKEIFDEESVIKEANILQKSRNESEINTKPIKIVLFTLFGLAIAIPAVFFGYRFLTDYLSQKEVVPEPKLVNETSDINKEEVAVVEEVKPKLDLNQIKKDTSVQVLNGTGEPGLAASLQEGISDLGYEDIEIGNAPAYTSTYTLVQHNSDIPEALLDELEDYLYTVFEELDLEEFPDDTQNENDIIITTGNLLENTEGGDQLE